MPVGGRVAGKVTGIISNNYNGEFSSQFLFLVFIPDIHVECKHFKKNSKAAPGNNA